MAHEWDTDSPHPERPPAAAFIGLGTMGRPMAQRLVDAGYALTVYDLSESAVKALVARHARPASSAREAAVGADVVITMLPASDDVKQAALGPAGALAGMRRGTVLIDMSTIDPDTATSIAAEAERHGVAALDAPVSGSSAGAVNGSLTIMAGGDAEVLEAVRPLLSVLGNRIFHCGGHGAGTSMKLANQIMAGASMVAVAEGFALAQALGVDPKLVYQVATASSGNCWSLQTRPPVRGVIETSPVENDFAPGFKGSLMRKDLDLALTTGRALSLTLQLTATARALYDRMIDEGLADRDFSAVFETLRRGA